VITLPAEPMLGTAMACSTCSCTVMTYIAKPSCGTVRPDAKRDALVMRKSLVSVVNWPVGTYLSGAAVDGLDPGIACRLTTESVPSPSADSSSRTCGALKPNGDVMLLIVR
jgi:hypothetical protein